MGRCNASITYNIPNSDDSPNWRTATCSYLLNDAGTEHDVHPPKHWSGNVNWDGPIGQNIRLPDGQLPDGA